jgi:singapore isolate B (sub-type 7) whole genome shotgun sequence assembly, scaffold_0
LEIDGLPIWAKVGDLNMSEEEIEEMEKKGVYDIPHIEVVESS